MLRVTAPVATLHADRRVVAVARRRMQELVSWTVEDPPLEARLAGGIGLVVSTVAAAATFGTTTGAGGRPTWEVPAEPDVYVDIGDMRVRGEAPWLPGRPGAPHRLRATSRAVVLDDPRRRRAPTPVPLADLHVAQARLRGRGRRPRRPDARWTLTLTGAGTVEVQGAWLALAWIGLLAGWPEPQPG